MAKVDRFVAANFLRLKAPEFDALRGYLNAVYQEALVSASTVDSPDHWRKFQGRAQLCKELLDLMESSSDLVAKFDGRP